MILALENEFSEIIYILFGGRQTISSTIVGTKIVVICAAKKFENRLTSKDFMPEITLEHGFCIGKRDNP